VKGWEQNFIFWTALKFLDRNTLVDILRDRKQQKSQRYKRSNLYGEGQSEIHLPSVLYPLSVNRRRILVYNSRSKWKYILDSETKPINNWMQQTRQQQKNKRKRYSRWPQILDTRYSRELRLREGEGWRYA